MDAFTLDNFIPYTDLLRSAHKVPLAGVSTQDSERQALERITHDMKRETLRLAAIHNGGRPVLRLVR